MRLYSRTRLFLISLTVIALVLVHGQCLWAAMDEATIKRLEQIIQQQQQQIDAQAQAIEELKQQVQALGQKEVPRTEAAVKEDETVDEAKLDAGAKAAPSEFLKTGNPNVSVKLYGHVNEAVLATDDGYDDNFFVVSNSNSTTRFGIIGTAGSTDTLEAGSRIEVQFVSNPSVGVSQFEDNQVGTNNFTKRWLDLYFASHLFGKLSIGHGDTASNNSAEFDLSGTAVIGYSGVEDMAGGHFFYNNLPSSGTKIDADGNTMDVINPPGYTETTISEVFNNLDGLGRNDRIRYDTPNVYGFGAATSYASGGAWDVALHYTGKMPGRRILGRGLGLPSVEKLVGAIAYANQRQSTDDRDYRLSGSISTLFDNGITLTAAGGRNTFRDSHRDDMSYWYGKIGYRKAVFDIGETAVAIDYGQYDGFDLETDSAETWGALLVQNLYSWGTEYYLGYRWHHLDREGADLEDIHALMSGFRLKF